nr:uncharacterized protein CI109_006815 [Kwoniella shandongensis]KAA5524865.1 hypothetical protein CI109_006815 [Kwoniella shandongensis]
MYGSEPAATHGEAQLPAAPAAYLSNDDLNWLSASDQVPLLGRQPSRHRRQVQPFELDGGRNQHLHTQILELEGPLVQPQEMEGEYGSTYQRVSRSYTAPHAPLAGSPQELPARSSRDQEGGATLYFPVTPSSTRSSQPTLEWERSSPHSKTRRASIALPPSAQPYGEYYGQAGNDHANQAPPSYPHHDAYRSANPTSGYSIPAAGTSVLPIAPSREGETTGRGPTWIKAIQPNSSSERSGKRKKDKGKLVDFGNSIVRSLTPQNHKRPPISRPNQNIDPSTSTWGVKQYLDLQNPGAARSFCDLRALRATCGNDASWVAINPSKYKDILEENAEDDFTAREIWDLQKENCFLRNEYREKRSRWKRQ